MPATKRIALTIGLLVGALSLAGCGTMYEDLVSVKMRPRAYKPQPQTSKHKENYLQFLGKGKTAPRFGFLRSGYELFAPWRVGLRMGGFEQKALQYSLNQQGCIEFDVPNSNPLQFAAFCGFKNSLGGDWSLTVGYNLGGSSGQSPFVDFNGAGDRIKMKVEADAMSMIRFYAKPEAVIDWTLVYGLDAAALGLDLTQDSLLPAVGGSSLNNKGEMGFASFWGSTAPRPNATDEEMVLDSTMEGIKLNLKAVQRLDNLVPDDVNALDHLNEAKLSYQSAYDRIVADLPDTKENGKALNFLGKAIQFSDKAIEKTQDEKWKPAMGQSKKAAKSGGKAADIYFKLDLDF